MEKKEQINKLTVEMLELCLKAAKIAIKPCSKYKITNDRRAAKITAIVLGIASLRSQVFVIQSQPIFPKDGITAIIHEGDEVLIRNNRTKLYVNDR